MNGFGRIDVIVRRWGWLVVGAAVLIGAVWMVTRPSGWSEDELRRATFHGIVLAPYTDDCGDPGTPIRMHRAEAGGHAWYTSGFPTREAKFSPDRTYSGTLQIGVPNAEGGTKQGIFTADGNEVVVYKNSVPYRCSGGAPDWQHG